MKKLKFNSKKFFFTISNLEKKHKIITYASLLFLTVSTYFLRTENQTVKTEFTELKNRNKGLRDDMVIFNRNYENFPLPVWQKIKRGDNFVIQYINPEYVRKFGHFFDYNPYKHIGKNNFQAYLEGDSQEYNDKDMAVAISGNELHSTSHTVDKDGNPIYSKIVKWREIKDSRDTLVYGMVKEFIKK